MLYVGPATDQWGTFRLARVRMNKDTPRELIHDEGKEVPVLIASMPASAQQRRTAFGVVIFLSVVFAIVMPFATIQIARVDAFHSGCSIHSLLCRSHYGGFSVCSIFNPTSACPSGSRKRLYIQRPVRVFANA